MPTVKNVGEPCAGEPHARFEVAAGGNQASRASRRAAQAPPADPTATASPPWDCSLSLEALAQASHAPSPYALPPLVRSGQP